MIDDMKNFFGLTPADLELYFTEIGENPAKARIVFDGIYRKRMESFSELPISHKVKERLSADLCLSVPEIVAKSEGESYAKLLLKLADGEFVESVLMRQKFGAFVCVSTQVGCNMGCAFCCSGRLRKIRNLTAAEIVSQVIAVQRCFGEKVQGISVMGIGEPFDNFDAVMALCEIATAPVGLEIAKRRITVSTCGIVSKIYSYADSEHCCNLAISLHAADDELRSRLMPINNAYALSELMASAEYFSKRTNSRVTLEYVMIKGVNDSLEDAQKLADLVGDSRFYVNMIPYNPTDGDVFDRTEFSDIMRFYDVLKQNGVHVTLRREFGAGDKAACGQLSSDYSKNDHERGT